MLVLEGEWPYDEGIVIERFRSMKALKEFWYSDGYQEAKKLREGVAKILAAAGRAQGDVSRMIHSTTIATNAILEQKGAVTGILMTGGFEDALEIGRQKRSDMYNMFLDAETPVFLAPRRLRVAFRNGWMRPEKCSSPWTKKPCWPRCATCESGTAVRTPSGDALRE